MWVWKQILYYVIWYIGERTSSTCSKNWMATFLGAPVYLWIHIYPWNSRRQCFVSAPGTFGGRNYPLREHSSHSLLATSSVPNNTVCAHRGTIANYLFIFPQSRERCDVISRDITILKNFLLWFKFWSGIHRWNLLCFVKTILSFRITSQKICVAKCDFKMGYLCKDFYIDN